MLFITGNRQLIDASVSVVCGVRVCVLLCSQDFSVTVIHDYINCNKDWMWYFKLTHLLMFLVGLKFFYLCE